MSATTTLHIPLESDIRKKFTAKAKQLGFDSAQAYLRVLIKADVDGRTLNFNANAWGEPSPEAAARLDTLAEEALADSKAGKLKSFTNVEDFLADLKL